MASARRPLWRIAACALLVGLLALLPAGCGDDDKGGSGTPKSNAAKFDEGVRSLANFGSNLTNSPDVLLATQMVGAVGNLFPGGLRLAGQVLTAPDLASAAQRMASLAPQIAVRPPRLLKAGLTDYFGVYQCDPEDVTEPFPGWVLLEETPNPENSIILRFDEACGFVYYDDRGREQTAVGELRLTNVEVIVDPNDPEADLPTQFDFEMWAAPLGQQIVPIMRVTFDAMWDENGDPTSLTIGNPTASSPSNPDASFLGPLVFYLGIGVTDLDTNLAVQLYDSSGRYAVRAAAELTGDLSTEEFSAVNLQFAFGSTTNPSQPPFLFDFTASDYDAVNDVWVIDGSISLHGEDLAVFTGDTSEVPVDVDTNGDEVIDDTDTCPNITMTFTDDPESSANICENIEQLIDLLSGLLNSVATLSLQ